MEERAWYLVSSETTPSVGEIKVLISLNTRPEYKRSPYKVEILQYRDNMHGHGVEWRWFRDAKGYSIISGEPKWFKSLEKALEYKNKVLFWEEYDKVKAALEVTSESITSSGPTGSFIR